MSNTTNILIVGVGGQGIILSSEVISSVALTAGMDVKQSEVHGMAQRGGSVSSHVRFGDKIYSPTIEKGQADILLSFELMETLRWVEYLSDAGTAVVNVQQIDPMPVASGKAQYPADVLEQLDTYCSELIRVKGQELALEAGHIKAVNTVMMGVLSNRLDFSEADWKAAIEKRVPPKTIDINFKAFDLGKAV
jgi:indolepyruvate ferredoxin oxidoreductase beta subunit